MNRAWAPGTRPSPPPSPPLLLSLLLLLLSPTVRGECGPPPEFPNASTELAGQTKFTEGSKVNYSCNKGFQQIPDKANTVVCLGNGEWSSIETFCNKTCDAPTRLHFASLKKEYISYNFFPIGTIVEYECRPGYRRVPSLSGKSTCLENLEWSPVAEFCKKKPCPNPGELKNGHINILTDILFGSEIVFSCNTGYRLVGAASAFCSLIGNTVNWDEQLPVCTEIYCPDPLNIDNGEIRGESDSYVYRQSVTYVCNKGFILVGNSSIYCTVNQDQGEWSDPPPKCIEKSKIPTTKKPTTRAPPTSQEPTTVKVPATQHAPATKTTVHHPTKSSKDEEKSTSGGDHFIYGHAYLITLTVLHAMLLLIG